jgi:phosphoglycolate phosphatase
MKYDLLIFDFDGTLADSYPWFSHNLNQVAEKYRFRKVKADEQILLRQLHARQIIDYLGISRWKLPMVIAHMRRLMSRDIDSVKLFDGVAELLPTLNKAGIELAIVSSNKLANVEKVLGSYTRLIRYKECGTRLFGKPRKIRTILRKANTVPVRSLYLGDEIRDTDAARETGLDICSVTWGYNLRNALIDQNPTYIADSVNDILMLTACHEMPGPEMPGFEINGPELNG